MLAWYRGRFEATLAVRPDGFPLVAQWFDFSSRGGFEDRSRTLSFRRRPNLLGRDRVVVVRQVYREGWRGPNQVGKVTVRPEAVPVLSVEEASLETVAPFITELYGRFSGDWGFTISAEG